MTRPDMMASLGAILAGKPVTEPAEPARIEALCAAAVEQGVAALAWERLGEGEPSASSALREALYPAVRAAVTREIFLQREVQSVLSALAQAGIPALVTKGTALAYTVYREPWFRPRIDTDLLVRRRDLEGAAGVLVVCGYERSSALSTGEHVSHQVAFERSGPDGVRHVFDLHWRIANPQLVAGSLPFDELWEGARPVPRLGDGAWTPSATASLALACVHRLAHHQEQERLVWLYDMVMLARTMQPPDWDAFADLAERQRISAMCLDGLLAAHRHLGLAVPGAVQSRLAAAAPSEASRVYAERQVTRRDVLLSDLERLGSWRARIRLLREHVFPPPAFMRQRYGTHARWPLPALYLHRFVTGAVRWNRS